MNRSKTAISIILLMVSTSSGVAQSADPIEELKACARMTDRDARFVCLDNLGERVLREESADEKPTREVVAQSEAVTTATEINAQPAANDRAVSKSEDDQESTNIIYSGTITSCRKGHFDDWYFTFDNGQVWKEMVRRKLRLKECNFSATITKDVFGHNMKVDAFEKAIRIKRYK